MTHALETTSPTVELSDTDAKARRAVKAFRSLQPTLSAYARVLTGNPKVRVEMSHTNNGATDGTRIFYRPPIALGDNEPHQRKLCDKRAEDLRQLCPACQIREEVIVIILHEIFHICFDSFQHVSENDKADALRRAIEACGTKYADKLETAINDKRLTSFNDLSQYCSKYLPFLVNALEDARIECRGFEARKGTKNMFTANVYKTFTEGFENRNAQTGEIETIRWSERPLDPQASVALYVKSAGYTYGDWFAPEVMAALADPTIDDLCFKVRTAKSVSDVYYIAFPMLARMRELGFFRDDYVPEDEEEPPPPMPPSEPEESDDDEESDSDGDDSEDPESDPGNPGSGESGPDPADGGGDSDGDLDDESEGSDESESDSSGTDAGTEPGDGGAGDEDLEPSGEGADSDNVGTDEDSEGDGVGEKVHPDESDEGEDGEGGGSPGSESSDQGGDGPASDSDGDSDGPEDVPEGDSDEGRGDPSDGSGPDGPGERDGRSGSDPGAGGDDQGDSPEESHGDGADTEATSHESSSEEQTDADSSDTVGDDKADPERYDGDEPIDTGADDGTGGGLDLTEESEAKLPSGTPEDVEIDLIKWLNHDEKPNITGTMEEVQSVEKAIIQGLYFEQPSANIWGVREHYYGRPVIDEASGHNFSRAWGAENDDEEYSRGDRVSGRAGDFEPPESLMGPALLKTRRAFSDNARGHETANLKSGKVNARVLGKRANLGDPRLFKQRRLPGKRSYFVVIMMDISGSTFGQNILIMKQAVMAQATLLHRAGIPFAIYAQSGYVHSFSSEGLYASTRDLDMDIYILKEGHEPWDTGVQTRLRNIGPDCYNLDGHALEYARKRVMEAKATDRIILFYSDGKMPAENYDEELPILQREIRWCQHHNVTLLGVGIRTDSPARHGLETVQLDDVTETGKVVEQLEKYILRNKTRSS